MAKKKQVESDIATSDQPIPQVEPEVAGTEMQQYSAEVEVSTQEPETEETVSGEDEEGTEEHPDPLKDAPDFVVDYMKRHTELEVAYIDKQGGVFQTNTPEVFLKEAVLYQNSFYKQ